MQLGSDAGGWWGVANVLLGARVQPQGPHWPDPLPARMLKQHPTLQPAVLRLQKVLILMQLATVMPSLAFMHACCAQVILRNKSQTSMLTQTGAF